MGKHTDLAIEEQELWKESARETTKLSGVEARETVEQGIKITCVRILNEEGSQALHKPVGQYLTLEITPDHCRQHKEFATAVTILARKLQAMMKLKQEQTVLVVGLGNLQVTPDAVGPKTLEQLMVTRHLLDGSVEGCRAVSALAPGVLGTTGLESVEIVKGVVETIKPDCVVAVDALAARSLDRLCTTVQLASSGIVPGSGIGNSRSAFNEETLGVPVYAVGVPTVVEVATLVEDVLQSHGQEKSQISLKSEAAHMVVTVTDIDAQVSRIAKVIAYGINLGLQENMSLEDIAYFVE